MIPVFASTTAILAAEFVECFPWPSLKLSTELSRIGMEAGVEFTTEDKTFSVTGHWKQLVTVYESLQNMLEVQMELCEHEGIRKNTIECDDNSDSKTQAERVGNKRKRILSKPKRYKQAVMAPSFDDETGGMDEIVIKTERTSGEHVTDYTRLYDSSHGSSSVDRHVNQCMPDDENNLARRTEHDEEMVLDNANYEENLQQNINEWEGNDTDSSDDNMDRAEKRNSGQLLPEVQNLVEDYLTLSCTECDYVANDESDLRDHVEHEHNTDVTTDFQCNLCDKHFTARHILDEHVSSFHRVSSTSFNVTKSKAKKLRILLEPKKRGRPVKNQETPVDLEGPFNCFQCNYVGQKFCNLKEHVKRQHRVTKQACKICGKLFGYNKDMRRHVEDVHGDPKYFCTTCEKSYKSKLGYDNHMQTHSENYVKPDRPLVYCEICGKSCCSKQAHDTHVMTVHEGIRPYLCQTCGKSFSQAQTYRMHMNAHAGIKPYACNTCGKTFSYAKSLTDHTFIHDSVGQFTCEICAKTFKQRQSLLIHMTVHKERKDHICKDCGKGFTQKQALQRHERLHSGVMPYLCGLCQRSFSDQSVIRRHVMLVHKKDAKTWKENIIEKTPNQDNAHPKGDGQLYPKGDGQLYPKGDGQLYPKGDGQVYPKGDGQVYDMSRNIHKNTEEIHDKNVEGTNTIQVPEVRNHGNQEVSNVMPFPDVRNQEAFNAVHFLEVERAVSMVRPPYKPYPWL